MIMKGGTDLMEREFKQIQRIYTNYNSEKCNYSCMRGIKIVL